MVVFGHELQTFYSNFDQLFIFKFIYSFHMPLFMIISGYLANMSLQKNGCSFEKCVLKKFLYLMIPFLSWYIIGLIWQDQFVFAKLMTSLLFLFTHVDSGLWYLYVLFVLYIFLYIANKFKYKYFVFLLIFLLLPASNILGANQLLWYIQFFVIGMLLFEFQGKIKELQENSFSKLIYIVPFLYFFGLHFWEREYMNGSQFANVFLLYEYKFLIAILGSLTIYLLLSKLYSAISISAMFDLFGKQSLKIYVLNFILIKWLHTYVSQSSQFLLFLFAIAISYFIVWSTDLVKDYKIAQLLFGEYARKRC